LWQYRVFLSATRQDSLLLAGPQFTQIVDERGGLAVDLRRPGGEPIGDGERLRVAAMDSVVLGLMFNSAPRPPGFFVAQETPVMREVVEDWLRARGGHLSASELVDATHPRWDLGADLAECVAR